MAATLSRFFFDSTGELCRIVHPSNDVEILDARHDIPGQTGVNVIRANYALCTNDRDVFAFLQPLIAQVRPLLGDLLTQRVALIDAIAQLRTDQDLVDTRQTAWPSPTPAQQLLINAAKAKVIQSLQDIQTIRDAIAAIKAQL